VGASFACLSREAFKKLLHININIRIRARVRRECEGGAYSLDTELPIYIYNIYMRVFFVFIYMSLYICMSICCMLPCFIEFEWSVLDLTHKLSAQRAARNTQAACKQHSLKTLCEH